ncbi:MAG: hypothetical protein Q9227_009062 [Pyrenula ochraceoflavens]
MSGDIEHLACAQLRLRAWRNLLLLLSNITPPKFVVLHRRRVSLASSVDTTSVIAGLTATIVPYQVARKEAFVGGDGKAPAAVGERHEQDEEGEVVGVVEGFFGAQGLHVEPSVGAGAG